MQTYTLTKTLKQDRQAVDYTIYLW